MAAKGQQWRTRERALHAEELLNRFGHTVSQETRDKLSRRFKGRVVSKAQRKEISKTIKYRLATEPALRKRYAIANASKSRRKKLSLAAKKRWQDPVLRKKYIAIIRKSKKDRPMTLAQRKAISKTLTGYKRPTRTTIHKLRLSRSLRKPATRALLAAKAAYTRTRLAKPNRPEKQLFALLEAKLPGQFILNVKDGKAIGGKIPDFIHRKEKLLIELFGDYWHSKQLTGRSRPAEVRRRRSHFAKFGYRLIVIWCSDLKDVKKVYARIAKET